MRRTGWVWALVLALAASPAAAAERAFLLVGLDGKTFFTPDGPVNGPNGDDGLAIVDISDPARPRVAHVIGASEIDTSVYGPPTNLGITPDGRLGLVTSPVMMRQEGQNFWAQADDRLFVIDLTAEPPKVAQTLRVGRQPSGLAISRSGTLALVANREGGSITVLAIGDGRVRVAGEVPVGGAAAAVAIAPDGARALVAKNTAGTIGALSIRDGTVTYDPALDMPVGPNPYGLEFIAGGAFALSANAGPAPSDGHADTVALIGMEPRPRVLDHVGVGDTAETMAVSPDGRLAAVSVVGGASAPQASPAYATGGAAVLVGIAGGRLRRLSEAPAGAVTQGIAFDPSGRYVYVGNYRDRTLGVYTIDGDAIRETGLRLALPGQPASLRGRP